MYLDRSSPDTGYCQPDRTITRPKGFRPRIRANPSLLDVRSNSTGAGYRREKRSGVPFTNSAVKKRVLGVNSRDYLNGALTTRNSPPYFASRTTVLSQQAYCSMNLAIGFRSCFATMSFTRSFHYSITQLLHVLLKFFISLLCDLPHINLSIYFFASRTENDSAIFFQQNNFLVATNCSTNFAIDFAFVITLVRSFHCSITQLLHVLLKFFIFFLCNCHLSINLSIYFFALRTKNN